MPPGALLEQSPIELNRGIFGIPKMLWICDSSATPALKPGDILVMDNVAFHKVAGVREAIEARGGRLLYLPPYSPDLNPIEQAFSKLKSFLRKAGARTKETLWQAIGDTVEKYNHKQCLNDFKNSGYAT